MLWMPEVYGINPGRGATLRPDHPLMAGLAVALYFDSDGGSLIADWLSCLSPGTLVNGAAWDVSPYGPCLKFDGTNDYATFSDSVLLKFGAADAFTVAVRFAKDAATPTASEVLVGKRGNTGAGFQVHVTSSNKAGFQLADGTNTAFMSIDPAVSGGEWHTAVVVVDRRVGSAIGYLDGAQGGSTGISSIGSPSNSHPVRLGIYSDYSGTGTTSQAFAGKIEHALIWARALGDGEVARYAFDPYDLLRPRPLYYLVPHIFTNTATPVGTGSVSAPKSANKLSIPTAIGSILTQRQIDKMHAQTGTGTATLLKLTDKLHETEGAGSALETKSVEKRATPEGEGLAAVIRSVSKLAFPEGAGSVLAGKLIDRFCEMVGTGSALCVLAVNKIARTVGVGTAAHTRLRFYAIVASVVGSCMPRVLKQAEKLHAQVGTGSLLCRRSIDKLILATAAGTAPLLKSVSKRAGIVGTGSVFLLKAAAISVLAVGQGSVSLLKSALKRHFPEGVGSASMNRGGRKGIAVTGTGSVQATKAANKRVLAVGTGIVSRARQFTKSALATAAGIVSHRNLVTKLLETMATGTVSRLALTFNYFKKTMTILGRMISPDSGEETGDTERGAIASDTEEGHDG